MVLGMARSIVAGAAAAGAGWLVARWFSEEGTWEVAEALGAFVVGGATVALVFAGAARMMGSREVKSLWAGWLRNFGRHSSEEA